MRAVGIDLVHDGVEQELIRVRGFEWHRAEE